MARDAAAFVAGVNRGDAVFVDAPITLRGCGTVVVRRSAVVLHQALTIGAGTQLVFIHEPGTPDTAVIRGTSTELRVLPGGSLRMVGNGQTASLSCWA